MWLFVVELPSSFEIELHGSFEAELHGSFTFLPLGKSVVLNADLWRIGTECLAS